jgi:lysophospholipase L1-like esterase
MTVEMRPAGELADRHCLRPGEAGALLAGHPWRRFVAVGDSVVSGEGDQVQGYPDLPWVDRVATELTQVAPDLVYLNLGERDLLAAQVRTRQLNRALEFRPDLALVACGINDALRSSYRPDLVDAEIGAIMRQFRELNADVITLGIFDTTYAPAIPVRVKHLIGARVRTFSARTAALAQALGGIHVNVTGHPAEAEPGMHSADGLHGNMRAHAICATEAIRRLGRYLGNTFDADRTGADRTGADRTAADVTSPLLRPPAPP